MLKQKLFRRELAIADAASVHMVKEPVVVKLAKEPEHLPTVFALDRGRQVNRFHLKNIEKQN